jgi:hypothetical protein
MAPLPPYARDRHFLLRKNARNTNPPAEAILLLHPCCPFPQCRYQSPELAFYSNYPVSPPGARACNPRVLLLRILFSAILSPSTFFFLLSFLWFSHGLLLYGGCYPSTEVIARFVCYEGWSPSLVRRALTLRPRSTLWYLPCRLHGSLFQPLLFLQIHRRLLPGS